MKNKKSIMSLQSSIQDIKTQIAELELEGGQLQKHTSQIEGSISSEDLPRHHEIIDEIRILRSNLEIAEEALSNLTDKPALSLTDAWERLYLRTR